MATWLASDRICDDCGEVIPAGDPVRFNAAQEAVHKNCGEELHVKIAVSRRHLEQAESAILQEVQELARREVRRKRVLQVSPLREVLVNGEREEVFKGSDAVLVEFVCRAIR